METNEKLAALSDIGLRRKNNEDAAYAVKNQYGTLLVVADGMGGHRKGEVASKIVVDTLSIRFNSEHHVFNARRGKKFYKKQMKKANQEIYKMSLSGDEYREMGTTLVSALIDEKETRIFSVGDSRCYLLGLDGILKQVTRDQTYVQFLFENGKITKSEMATHPQKNLLINAVGINPDLTDCEEFLFENETYKSILLCSDGLYNMVNDEEIQSTMNKEIPAIDKARELIKKALDKGGNDNIAVAIYDN